jgi:hypothetical protein
MNLAMMYAMNVGIQALQGKRGNNLWKDAFKDTALMASFQGLDTGQVKAGTDPAAGYFGSQAAGMQGVDVGFKKALSQKPNIVNQMTQTVADQGKTAIEKLSEREKFIQTLPKWGGQEEIFSEGTGKKGWFDKVAGVFKSPQQRIVGDQPASQWFQADGQIKKVPLMEMKTDRVKVGLGAGALGATLYGAGMFDPVPPAEPKYPGYNKFYAENPGQFMPYDDPDIDPIDYSKYPDKPYSGIKKGGIIGLQTGGSHSSNWQLLYNQYIQEGLSHEEASASATATADMMPNISDFFKQQGGIAAFAKGGRASNQPNQNIVEATEEEEERRRQQEQVERQGPSGRPAPGEGSPRIPYDEDGGIGGYGPGRRAMPQGSYAPTPQIDPRWFHPDNPRFLRPETQGVKAGALIHKLPSKTKVDENNPKNYKRTSGKLVVDKAGKGSENKDTMLAQLADGEFVTKSKAVRGAGLALGANPKDKKQQKDLGARYFYKQMAEFDKLAKQMAS